MTRNEFDRIKEAVKARNARTTFHGPADVSATHRAHCWGTERMER